MTKSSIKAKITVALQKGIKGSKSKLSGLIPPALTAGKLYEAYVLGLVCQRLRNVEGFTLTLVASTKITLKSSPGPINPTYPHIRVSKGGLHVANIWTDVEFTSLSADMQGTSPLGPGDYHELDIAMVTPKANSRPLPSEVFLAVECKNTGYQKGLLREILGVRRELSLLTGEPKATVFGSWPQASVRANPPSCVAVYSTDQAVLQYASPGSVFGIKFYHEPL